MTEMSPPFLFKYYSPFAVQKAIEGTFPKWDLPSEQNDPFEALPDQARFKLNIEPLNIIVI